MGDSYRPDRRRSRSPRDHYRGRQPHHDSEFAGDGRGSRRGSYHGAGPRRDGRFGARQGEPHEPSYDEEGYNGDATDIDESYRAKQALEARRNDAAPDMPLRILLVTGLKRSSTESLFAKGMEKFQKGFDDVPGGAAADSILRIFLIRGRLSDDSMGYGFVEFNTTENAEAAVHKSWALKKANRCTIGSEEVELQFATLGVFPNVAPAYANTPGYQEKFTFVMPHSGRLHKYHDDNFYASEFPVNPMKVPDPALVEKSEGDRPKKKVKAGTKRGPETLESSSKKAKGSGLSSIPMMQQWGLKQAELRGEDTLATQEAPNQPATGVNTVSGALSTTESHSDEQTFAYDGTMSCYLCVRKFDSTLILHKHVNESELHSKNLEDEKLVAAGYSRMKDRDIDPDKTYKSLKASFVSVPAASQSKAPEASNAYRDRAAERRQEEGKIGRFSLKDASVKKQKGGNKSGSSSENESSKSTSGKGWDMMQKAGWSKGSSLGAGGGITAPIGQTMYASGVGLGHESSKKGDAVEEASRMTLNNRLDFQEKVKENAAKRYASLE